MYLEYHVDDRRISARIKGTVNKDNSNTTNDLRGTDAAGEKRD